MNQPSEMTRMNEVGFAQSASGTKIAPQNLAEIIKFAEVMSRADIALPPHLRGNTGACMAVAMQALEWEMSPFAVASKSYVVKGAVAYEAQLIAAVVNTRSGIKGRLKYRYDGEGAAMTCTVSGVLDGDVCEYTSPEIGSILTKNSPLWKADPQQQLGYFSARSWARRHCPEVILGVYDREEAEQFQGPDNARDVTPAKLRLKERLKQAPPATTLPAHENEGFNADHVQRETDRVVDGDIVGQETGELTEANSNTDQPSSFLAEPVEGGGSSLPSPSPLTEEARGFLMEFAVKALKAVKSREDKPAKLAFIDNMELNYREAIEDEFWPNLAALKKTAFAVIEGKRTIVQALEFLTDALDCTVADLGGAP